MATDTDMHSTASRRRVAPSPLVRAALKELCNPVVMAVVVLGLWGTIQPYLVRNVTQSLPPGWYWCRPHYTNEPLAPGTLVLFTPPASLTTRLAKDYPQIPIFSPWLKQVQTQAGDNLYVQGTHPASLDSRHFGPIARGSVHAVCRPLWVGAGQ